MSDDVTMVRAIWVTCGVHDGGRPCGRRLARFGLLNGEVVAHEGDTAIRGPVDLTRLEWTDGSTIRIVACAKHGVFRIGEPEIAGAIRRGQMALPASAHMPGFKTRSEIDRSGR